jgi:MerR family mercuric resistance operon transcriptional regulator
MSTDVTIGKLAEAAGVNVETIRYYQRRGLLEEPAKPLYGQRRYSSEQAKRVRFIKRAQAPGFTLAEVGQLLLLNEARSCKTTRALAAHKLELIDEKWPTWGRCGRHSASWCNDAMPVTEQSVPSSTHWSMAKAPIAPLPKLAPERR